MSGTASIGKRSADQTVTAGYGQRAALEVSV
jgi:hypothetical protein